MERNGFSSFFMKKEPEKKLRRIVAGLLAAAVMLTACYGCSIYGDTQTETSVAASADGDVLVYPCGTAVGIYLQMDGVLIVGTGAVTAEDGESVNPAEGIVEAGDYIEAVCGQEVHSKVELIRVIQENQAEAVEMTVRRDGEEREVSVNPVRGQDGKYMLGIWVRDDTQGIGTLSYVTEDGDFAALGHGISDTDTGEIVETVSGSLYPALITSVLRGTKEKPGSLCGSIVYDEESVLGEITGNTSLGITGSLTGIPEATQGIEAVPLAQASECHTGEAVLRSDVSGEVRDYSIRIRKIDRDSEANKNLVIEVTDSELLALTGGIVQGLSGSPILQDGKMIGAVTHVLVNDPTLGYGIFAETMYEQSQN